VVQEYAWMGWDAKQVLSLFRDPSYPALHHLWRLYGETGIRERVDELLGQMGVFRFQAIIHEEPEPEESDDDLIQLGILASRREGKGDSHAESL
jgi:hypothetical protein